MAIRIKIAKKETFREPKKSTFKAPQSSLYNSMSTYKFYYILHDINKTILTYIFIYR